MYNILSEGEIHIITIIKEVLTHGCVQKGCVVSVEAHILNALVLYVLQVDKSLENLHTVEQRGRVEFA